MRFSSFAVIGASALVAAKLIGNAQLKVYKGGLSRHMFDQKDQVNADLLAFFEAQGDQQRLFRVCLRVHCERVAQRYCREAQTLRERGAGKNGHSEPVPFITAGGEEKRG
jgi:hypothetical protein